MIFRAKEEMYIVRAVLWAGSACPLPARQTAQGIRSTGQGGISPAKSTGIIIYVACVLGDHSVLAGGSATATNGPGHSVWAWGYVEHSEYDMFAALCLVMV